MADENGKAHQDIVRALMGIEPTDETYRQIGRFFHMFSQVEILLRLTLVHMIGARGDLFDEITAPYDFSSLCNVVKAVSKKIMPTMLADEYQEIAKTAQKLNEERVRIAHGTWLDSDQGMTSRHVSRSSLEAKLYYGQPGEVTKLADRATALQNQLAINYAALQAT